MDPRRLPAFSFITPNECNDAHSCDLATGDRWLSQQVPPLLAAAADVLITYDEGTTDLGVLGAGGVMCMRWRWELGCQPSRWGRCPITTRSWPGSKSASDCRPRRSQERDRPPPLRETKGSSLEWISLAEADA